MPNRLILTQEDVHYAADAIRGFLDLDRNTGCTILPVITRKRYEVTLNKLESATQRTWRKVGIRGNEDGHT